jgi:transcriptional regulator with XRE-family HTH domain
MDTTIPMKPVRQRKPQMMRPRVLPNRVRDLRVRKGVSLRACGDYVGVTAAAIYKAERQDCGLSVDNWLRLAEYFGVSLEFMKAKPDPA